MLKPSRCLSLFAALSTATLAIVIGPTKVTLAAGYTAVAFVEDRVTETYVTPANTTTAAFTYDGTAYKQIALSDRASLGKGKACFVFAASAAELEYYAENTSTTPSIDLNAGYNLVSFSGGFGVSGSSITASINGTTVNVTDQVNPGVYEIGPGNTYTLVDLRTYNFKSGTAYWMNCKSNGVKLNWPLPIGDGNAMSFGNDTLTAKPGGNLTIQILRTNFFGGNNTVQLVTTPQGTAVQGTDFPPINQTVSFATDTPTSGGVNVTVALPTSARAGRTIDLRLQNPQGTAPSLRAPAHAVVTIVP